MRSTPTPRLLQILNITGIMLVLALAIYGLIKLVWGDGTPSATVTHTATLGPVSRGELLSQFKLITVERQYRIPVMGSTFKPLPARGNGLLGEVARSVFGGGRVPGTTQNMVYEMVTTVTAGIDLSGIADSDIINSDRVTTVTLPTPEVLSVIYDSTASRIFAQDKPVLPYIANSAELLTEMQRTGIEKHRAEAQADEALMAKARQNAREQLQNFLEKAHPGREVIIQFNDPSAPNIPIGQTTPSNGADQSP